MSRPLLIQYEGAIYHVTCRGNERKDIYKDDADRERFLRSLNQAVNIYSIKLCTYVLMLMSNHFHLLLETPLSNLSEFMRNFNITYTGYFNRHSGLNSPSLAARTRIRRGSFMQSPCIPRWKRRST